MIDLINSNTKTRSDPLTREEFNAFLKRIEEAPPHPCSLGKHVVSSRALEERWEIAVCGNCYRPIPLLWDD